MNVLSTGFGGYAPGRALTRTIASIPAGDDGLRAKVSVMRQLAAADTTEPFIRGLALEAVRGVKERDSKGELSALYKLVRSRVRFVNDSLPYSEVLQRPSATLSYGAGDCDDLAILGAALAGALGYDADFVFVSTRPDRGWSHVYLRIYYPSRSHAASLGFDTSVSERAGWEVDPGRVTRRAAIPVFGAWDGSLSDEGDMSGAVAGLGAYVWRVDPASGQDQVVYAPNGIEPPSYGIEEQAPQWPNPAIPFAQVTPTAGFYSGAAWLPTERLDQWSALDLTGVGVVPDEFSTVEVQLPAMAGLGAQPVTAQLLIPGLREAIEEASAMAQAVAQLQYSHAVSEYQAAQAAEAREHPTAAGLGFFHTKLVGKASQAVAQATHAVQTAGAQAANQVKAAAQNVARQTAAAASQAGQTVSQAAHSVATAVTRTVTHTVGELRRQSMRAIDRMKLTPLRKIVLALTTTPPPASFVIAYKILQKNRDAVLRDLPASVRDFVTKLERNLESFVRGLREHVSGLAGWPEFKAKIARAYDQQSPGTRRAILIVTVLLLIIGIIVLIFAPAGAPLWGKGSLATYAAAFHAFYLAVGGSGISAMLMALLGLFRGRSDAPPTAVPTEPAEPTAAEQRDFEQTTEDIEKGEAAPAVTAAAIGIPIVALLGAALLL